ncbi:nhl repeat containing protein : Ring finger protein OS=Blastopirellula marina DSM 3645 GN=DSM3645_08622 PE=4 SV=1: NHL: NHL: NHL: NHL [Gemmataceae bacterium]|nr:nhl repeat containing protein : Ring finger protein OS=Blastopirellula marina DSM 3645 GN=DSM3645_08622 PE=4 SV=1: NHL: NHL: NHL: NHL [Gemmataceae bacterium]VTU01922.1 nhl repeat containing protein : Ring finger protein OS=Blastopirellula marina DSM 3645 GN=DSM3645_08622 PE=4 SV=1: NHL: NHL: NHL: NHL [Gemmataceae bacterium]
MKRLALITLCLVGCARGDRPDAVWGARGVLDGQFVRPRAAVIDRHDRLWVVDFTARVQAFDLDGTHLGVTFRTPDFRNGRPSGLGLTRDGELIVCDSHYHCLRVYGDDGTERRVIGGAAGSAPGQLGYVSDVVQDADGFFYLSEFGENDRITKLDADGNLVAVFGGAGTGPGQFQRLRALALGPDGNLYCADACNHRVQVLTRTGEFVREFGGEGTEPGRLRYPYDLGFGPGGELYVVEYGNQRVQKFTANGESRGVWGAPGGRPGQLNSPWALAVDRKGRVHVIDTENHRVQRVRL